MSDQTVSLEEAAATLRVRPATVLYWLRALPGIPFSHTARRLPPRFHAHDVGLLRAVRALSLDANYSARHIEQTLSCLFPAPGRAADVSSRLMQEIESLREEISFLAEESKELHRMVALLLQTAWSTAAAAADSARKNGQEGPGSRLHTEAWAPPPLE